MDKKPTQVNKETQDYKPTRNQLDLTLQNTIQQWQGHILVKSVQDILQGVTS